MEYLLKSTICLTALYGLYLFGFRRMSFHALNRFYLLFSLVLSLTIPLLNYERTEVVVLEPQAIEEVNIPFEEIQESALDQSTSSQPTKGIEEIPVKAIDWIQVLNTIYLLGVGVMIFVFTKNLLIVLYTIKKASTSMASVTSSVAERIRSHSSNNQKLKILLTKSQSNSSFFNYVFLNPDNLNPHEEALIIAHEGFHAQRLHTLDLVISGILKAVFWFNPIVYFYQKSLKQIHEYEVDALMSATYDGREYAHLLLKLGVAPNVMIINQFSTKPLSERIQFLFKAPTKNMKKLLYFLSLPLIAGGIMAFAEEKVVKVYQEGIEQKNMLKKSEKAEGNLKLQNYEIDTCKTQNTKPNIFTHKIDFGIKLDNIDSIKISINNQLLIEGKDYILKGNDIYLEQKYITSKAKIHVYSSAKGNYGRYEGTNIFTKFTKLEKSPYVKLNKVSNQPIFEVKNSKDFFIKQPSIFYKITKTEDTLRTILEANKLGKNPLVFINGDEYPSSVLYRINPNNMRGSEIYSKGSQRAIEKYGLRAEDGVIILNTTKKILLENEKQHRIAVDNVKKELDAPKKRVQRVVLKDLDGKEYEKVSVMRPDLVTIHFSVDVPIGGKIIFTVDGKSVNEEDIENAKQLYIGGGCGQTHGGKYDAHIDLNTK
jgi:beta-lactamase regulating signal transducer with metallopeptidase domain